jgi:hypothetical protein
VLLGADQIGVAEAARALGVEAARIVDLPPGTGR